MFIGTISLACGGSQVHLQDEQGRFVTLLCVTPSTCLLTTPVDEHGHVGVQRREAEGLSPAGLATQVVSGSFPSPGLPEPSPGRVVSSQTLGLFCPLVSRLYYCRFVYTFHGSQMNGLEKLKTWICLSSLRWGAALEKSRIFGKLLNMFITSLLSKGFKAVFKNVIFL